MRGNPAKCASAGSFKGSIPARAGEPQAAASWVDDDGVYPRACGGTQRRAGGASHDVGLSPRVRGNLHAGRRADIRSRSIPARAGEPSLAFAASQSSWVYPRACGGTYSCPVGATASSGLSPRVRGNPDDYSDEYGSVGSIPARAGEPICTATRMITTAVYPRACGGTGDLVIGDRAGQGLSPRVRGNQLADGSVTNAKRSIPARAGEPSFGPWRLRPRGVYPRACGGTRPTPQCPQPLIGLSPRVRGNRVSAAEEAAEDRSIPARAGEPSSITHNRLSTAVYPRACGGTLHDGVDTVQARGLSPRVRGNLATSRTASPRAGSIPARAGEPCHQPNSVPARRVYPRACGGTLPPAEQRPRAQGLSPRVRGNLHRRDAHACHGWSIPARAGEPQSPGLPACAQRVYPRACGGTGVRNRNMA